MAADQSRLFVGNLADQVTEDLLYELFFQVGPLEKVIRPNKKNGQTAKFAFVDFVHPESVSYAIQVLDGIKLFGEHLHLKGPENNNSVRPMSRSPNRYTHTSASPAPSHSSHSSSRSRPESHRSRDLSQHSHDRAHHNNDQLHHKYGRSSRSHERAHHASHDRLQYSHDWSYHGTDQSHHSHDSSYHRTDRSHHCHDKGMSRHNHDWSCHDENSRKRKSLPSHPSRSSQLDNRHQHKRSLIQHPAPNNDKGLPGVPYNGPMDRFIQSLNNTEADNGPDKQPQSVDNKRVELSVGPQGDNPKQPSAEEQNIVGSSGFRCQP